MEHIPKYLLPKLSRKYGIDKKKSEFYCASLLFRANRKQVFQGYLGQFITVIALL
jgi:hypothetical protein